MKKLITVLMISALSGAVAMAAENGSTQESPTAKTVVLKKHKDGKKKHRKNKKAQADAQKSAEPAAKAVPSTDQKPAQ